MAIFLDIREDELQLIHEEITTFLGGFEVDVDLTKEETLICLRNALLKFEKESAIWQLNNQFINVYGLPAGLALTNQIATVNFSFVRQITDWFASMQRVGGKIPWHKDYITLEPGRQTYFLDKESSKPYVTGTRRIHRVMWVAKPEIFKTHFNGTQGDAGGDDILYNSSWNYTTSGLNYGNNRLGFLGYTFDTVLLMQSMETRNKVLFSEFFHNLSGDVLEITPMPGNSLTNINPNTRLFYYYWEESEIIAGQPLTGTTANGSTVITNDYNFENIGPDGDPIIVPSANPNNSAGLCGLPAGDATLIANPLQMAINAIPWSYLSPWAQAAVKDIAFALCKYIQASKWRKIRKTFSTGEMSYEIEFDYASLLQEARDEENRALDNLRADFEKLNIAALTINQKDMTEAAIQISKRGGRIWMLG